MKVGTRAGIVGIVAGTCAVALALAGTAGCSFGSSTPADKADAAFHLDTGTLDTGFPDGNGGGGDTGAAGDAGGADGGGDGADGGGDGGTGDAGCGGDGGSGTWTCVGNMATPRTSSGIAALPGGKALVAGGWNPDAGVLTSAEVFDSTSGTFSATGSMLTPNLFGAYGIPWPAVGDGKVLVAGGLDATGALETQAEIYDPTAGTFSATGSLSTAVISMFPVVLSDANVVFLGGWNSTTGTVPDPGWSWVGSGTNVVQQYVPSSGTFGSLTPLPQDRLVGCNVVLSTGDILAIGGSTGPSSSESSIYDYNPESTQWSTVGTLPAGMTCTSAYLVSPTQIILLGDSTTAVADVLDTTGYTTTPTTGLPAGSTPGYAQLANGDVLAMANDSTGAASASTYLYTASTNAWTQVGDMGTARVGFPAPVLLTTGEVLVVGGTDASGNVTAAAELYHP